MGTKLQPLGGLQSHRTFADMRCVVFLIFLVSIAVLERLLRQPETKGSFRREAQRGGAGAEQPDGLYHLGNALGAYGSGPSPERAKSGAPTGKADGQAAVPSLHKQITP